MWRPVAAVVEFVERYRGDYTVGAWAVILGVPFALGFWLGSVLL